MAKGNTSGANSNDVILIVPLLLFFCALLSLLWFVASPMIGFIYRLIRAVESLGIWLFMPWGRYFFSVPHGQGYAFTSIFLSSMPFNWLFAASILGIGFLAYNKAKTVHIDAKIKNDKPVGYKDLMRMQAPIFPANQFFLNFPLDRYPMDRGPARMPMTALEFLNSCNAIIGIHNNLEATTAENTGWVIDTDAVTRRLVEPFGPLNPFADRAFPHTNQKAIEDAVAGIPWHLVSIIYVCLLRIHAMEVYIDDDDAFAKAYWEADEHLKNIWRDINRLKSEMGDRLTLGFVDDDDETLQRGIVEEESKGKIKGSELRTLKDVLTEKGDTFPTTTKSRTAIVAMLTSHLNMDPNQPTFIKNAKGKPKLLKDLNKAERARYDIRHKRLTKTITETIRGLLTRNGYMFGLTATLLLHTRRGGILPPALFRWMRFYDNTTWCYLRVVGMNTPTPEVAGMFDHYQVETKSGATFSRPYLTSSIEGIRREANKYITDEMRSAYTVLRSKTQASAKAMEAARLAARAMADEAAKRLKKGFSEKELERANRDPDAAGVIPMPDET
ncbi:hypothetical protein AD951_04085 [Acetobacter malorum]|uniref:DotM C-terminal cytoplasmic domain-containing protein n=1 Tax=Acetobacter malorum TaxID=178901 RepID=A0A149UQ13_9PROT|nr:hypothetical protein [Acetobacter malorum]KXV70027.1 hypothetical protein AD951_04085 [Acetobacter malorum]